MTPFSTNDLSQVLTLSSQGGTQTDAISNAISAASQLSNIVIISIIANYNTSANFWEGTLIYTSTSTTITFY